MSMENRIALVTGGGSGIGKAVSLLFARNAANVAVLDINLENAQSTVSEIEKAGGRALAISCDVSIRQDCFEAVLKVKEAWGKLDILINCAGILLDSSLKKLTEAAWDKVHMINLKGPLFLIQASQEIMKEQKYGRIVNLASGAYLGNPGQAAYSTSKAGVVSLTRTAALELARYGITVNCVAPGMIHTPMTAGMPEEAYEKLAKTIPSGRIGVPEDVSHIIYCLASDEASYTTGQTVFIDGGLTVGKSMT